MVTRQVILLIVVAYAQSTHSESIIGSAVSDARHVVFGTDESRADTDLFAIDNAERPDIHGSESLYKPEESGEEKKGAKEDNGDKVTKLFETFWSLMEEVWKSILETVGLFFHFII